MRGLPVFTFFSDGTFAPIVSKISGILFMPDDITVVRSIHIGRILDNGSTTKITKRILMTYRLIRC